MFAPQYLAIALKRCRTSCSQLLVRVMGTNSAWDKRAVLHTVALDDENGVFKEYAICYDAHSIPQSHCLSRLLNPLCYRMYKRRLQFCYFIEISQPAEMHPLMGQKVAHTLPPNF